MEWSLQQAGRDLIYNFTGSSASSKHVRCWSILR